MGFPRFVYALVKAEEFLIDLFQIDRFFLYGSAQVARNIQAQTMLSQGSAKRTPIARLPQKSKTVRKEIYSSPRA